MANSAIKKVNGNKNKGVDFEGIVSTKEYKALVAAKKKFLVPSVILFFGLYLLFPILISYTNALDAPAIGDISWAWIYALLLFVMTWTLATIYMKKSASFDHMAENVCKDDELGRRKG